MVTSYVSRTQSHPRADAKMASESPSHSDNHGISFRSFLLARPSIAELTKHVQIMTHWYIVGTLLELDWLHLEDIKQRYHNAAERTIAMFQLWLDTTPTGNRGQVLDALKGAGLNRFAVEYKKYIKEIYDSACKFTINFIQLKMPDA